MIIFEGIDGAGKSLVINEITKILNIKYIPLDYKNANKNTFFTENFKKYKDETCILHRFHLSELVYSKVLRNKILDFKKFEEITFGNQINKINIILLDIDAKIAYKRIKKRGEEITQNLEIERNEFIRYFSLSQVKNKIIIYNDNLKETLELAIGFIKNVYQLS